MSRSFSSVGQYVPGQKPAPMEIKYGKKPMLHIVDASNWMSRAFFAVQHQQPYTTNAAGVPVAAVQNFIQMATTLIDAARKDPNGCYVAFCFDPPSSDTWRYRAMEQFAEQHPKKFMREVFRDSFMYKGNRVKDPESTLPVQMAMARMILRKSGFWVGLEKPYEADDVVGTLVHRFHENNLIRMYSRDKDYVQMVYHKNIQLIMQKQSNSPEQVFTHKTAKDFFGVPAKRVVDMLALSGDSVDNVPGIPGIGEKTARDLILEYGSAVELRQAVLSGKCKGTSRWIKALRGEIPSMCLDLQLELVTIDTNVPRLPKDISAFAQKEPDAKVIKMLKKQSGLSTIFGL